MLLKADKNKILQKRQVVYNQTTELRNVPRLNVFSNSSYIYVQIIDDDKQVTLTEAKTMIKYLMSPSAIVAAARMVGHAIVNTALAAGITEVVFEARTPFTGFVKVLKETACKGGLKF